MVHMGMLKSKNSFLTSYGVFYFAKEKHVMLEREVERLGWEYGPSSSLTFSDFQRALGLAELLYRVQELFPPSLFQGLPCEGEQGEATVVVLSNVVDYTV